MGHKFPHTCGESYDPNSGAGLHRDTCSFCAAMAIVPEERSNTMIKIIEGEELQVQMMNLQKEAPASGVPDERTALKVSSSVFSKHYISVR